MCLKCQEEIWNTFSKTSNEKIDEYYSNNLDYKKRIIKFKDIESNDILNMISNCAIKSLSIESLEEYQIVALCSGDKLVVHFVPMMICGEAIGEIAELLSNKTLDIISGFISKHLGIPPEFKTKPKPKIFIF